MTVRLNPIGIIRSTVTRLSKAPKQGAEGAPDAWLEVKASVARALDGIAVGDEIIVITWLHRARRNVLRVHPRSDKRRSLKGVFATRSPHRPNPLGLHRVAVRELAKNRLLIGPIEAVEGTPVVDIKSVLVEEVGHDSLLRHPPEAGAGTAAGRDAGGGGRGRRVPHQDVVERSMEHRQRR